MGENESEQPPLTQEALEILDEVVDSDEGLAIKEAVDCLKAEGFTEADAENVIHQLLSEGRLYEVNQRVFVTP